jgi:hypothetical protein
VAGAAGAASDGGTQHNADVDWLTPVSTALGAAVALIGTVLAHRLSSRDEHDKVQRNDRRQAYVDYLSALDDAHARLRHLAEPEADVPDLATRARRAMGEARVYQGREVLLISGNTEVAAAGEQAMLALASLRDAVREGAKLQTLAYHNPYHIFADAVWRLRLAARKDLGGSRLDPADLERVGWDSQANCERCQRLLAQRTPGPGE